MPQKEKPTGLTAALIGALILVAFPISIFLFIQSNLLGSDAIIIGTGFSSNWLLIRLIALSIWAFIVAADERALGPLVFHEPLVASSIAGLLLGHFQSGVLCGLIFQAIWPGLQPMGGSLQPMAGISAIISLLWYISWSGFLGPLIFPVALAVALLAAHVSDRAEILARKRNETRTRRILDNPDKITDKKLFGLVQSV